MPGILKNELITKVREYAWEELKDFESGHDWWHSCRVWKTAVHIAEKEKADTFICSMAALLHDISDPKFADAGIESKTRQFLESLGLDEQTRRIILEITENISFGKGIELKMNKSIEFQVVQDADRLDAIGAIGVARAFNYGGYRNRSMHIPGSEPLIYNSSQEYRQSHSTTIMHFYEKLLGLQSLMNTITAKEIAKERHNFMLEFLERFLKEWNEYPEPV